MIIIKNNIISANFKFDFLSNEKIPLDKYRLILKNKFTKRKAFYISEIADLYYQDIYNKNIVEILSNFIEIPLCPVTNTFVSYKLSGKIHLGKFSSSAFKKGMSQYIAENNDSYKQFVNRMKKERIGTGNPMYGVEAWNKGLSAKENESVRKMTAHRIGAKTSAVSKKKQSESAKKRLIHGHTGIKHSEESKQIMRDKTIARLKAGKFPQTNTLPHKTFKLLINDIYPGEFEEEFKYGYYSFDFKFYDYLIEVHGDYWHANPDTRHSGATHSVQRINVSRDRAKEKFVNSNDKYKLLIFWENDILNKPEYIKECLRKLQK